MDNLDYSTNHLFIGEIGASYTEDDCLTDGKPDIKKINPLLLTMPDDSYWTVGDYVGKAWGWARNSRTIRLSFPAKL